MAKSYVSVLGFMERPRSWARNFKVGGTPTTARGIVGGVSRRLTEKVRFSIQLHFIFLKTASIEFYNNFNNSSFVLGVVSSMTLSKSVSKIVPTFFGSAPVLRISLPVTERDFRL